MGQSKSITNRRGFIGKMRTLLISGSAITPLKAEISSDPSNKRIIMLSQEGKLVEMDKDLFNKIEKKKQLPHNKIIKWIKKEKK